MNNQLSIQRKASFHFGLVLFASLGFALPALSEGSQQLGNGTQGLNVYLFEYNATNTFLQTNQGPRPIKVNVENANQVINISLCGWNTADVLAVEVFRPSGTEINYTTQVATGSPGAFNAAAADGAGAWRVGTGNARTTTQATLCTNQGKPNQPTGTLSNPVRFVAPEAGTYEIRLYNDSIVAGDTNANNVFTYFDVTVTSNASTNPDPKANNGQVWATSWAFNAGNAFTTAGAYDADLYIRTPGGRTGTEFIWQLDLNRFAPQRHEIIANAIGLNAPNSRGSVPGPAGSGGAAYTKSYPIYLSPPNSSSFIAPILPEPAPASVSNLSFVDNAGQDNTISPTTTSSVQDSGLFRFNSDVAGTYKITIDTNQDGVFGAGDRVLFGSATSGANAVAWDGKGDNNAVLNPGSYPVQVAVGLGEYHFVTYDAETSGGGTNDGLSIWKWNGSSRSGVSNFWDDTKITSPAGATKNLVGGLSGTAAGTHTWGNFASGSLGDTNYLDTWVFGAPQLQTTKANIATSDANDFADAPDTYGTNKDITVGGIPGSHLVNSNLHLGVNAPDSDTDGQPSVNADGDDINGTTPDDEDGVISFSPLAENATTYSVTVKVKNTTGAVASLGGWIDFNKDGQFQPSEGVVQSVPNNTNSDVTLTWNGLSGLVVGDIYARFRLNSDPLTTSDFNGGGRDGEVEDYKLAIARYDYGDAPSSFGNASHGIPATPTVYLGSLKPDQESGTQLGNDSGAAAAGDDNNGTPDDEDAFTALANVPTIGNYSLNVPVTNTSNGNATLHAWIDFNKNKTFEAGEYKSATVTNNSTSANLSWTVPLGTLPGSTHARFRLTSDSSINSNTFGGNASNGEVEDYPVTIAVPIYDYGDAPDTGVGTGTGNYQTTASDGGAAQVKINTLGQVLSLGSNIDTDDGSLQNATADADDTSGTPDDEDGVSSFPTLTTTANQTYTVPVSVSNNVPLLNAYLVGYIDFNKDGDFLDTGEKSATVTIPTSISNPRTFSVTFTTPTGMTTGNTYARFRLGSVQATAESATGASVSTDNGEVEDYQIAIATPTYTISGNVFDDADGSKVKAASGEDYTAADLTAVLLNGSNQVISSAAVNATGNYTLSNVLTGSYSVKIIKTPTTALTVGAVIPPASDILPTNWVATGENNNGTPDGTVDRTQTVTVASANIANLNFGIEQLPDTNNVSSTSQSNPGGTTQVQVPTLAGTDPEDGTLGSGKKFKIITLPTNGTLYYNGTTVTAGQTILAYDPTLLKVDPNDGSITVSFTYASVDAAGQADPSPATVTMPFAIAPARDYGDAPDTYGTDNTANNSSNTSDPVGANHIIIPGLFLGATRPDAETNGFVDGTDNNNGNAIDDDAPTGTGTGNGDDEDNFTLPTLTAGATSYTIPTSNITVTNTATPAAAATLHAWIDFNKNGKFDSTEYASATVVTSGSNPQTNLTWSGITVGTVGNTYARFRLTSDSSINNNTPGGAANSGEVEDYQVAIAQPVASNPKLLLVKRITAINPGQPDAIQFNNFVNDGSPADDEAPNWPDSDSNRSNNINTYLRGAINVPGVKPGDEVEYTIYFLSNGNVSAKNVTICDVVPDNMTFVANSYSANFGMALASNGTTLPTTTNKNLSNAIGDDEADYYPPNTNPAVSNLCKKHDSNNPNNLILLNSDNNLSGAVLINLSDPIPPATGSGIPPNSYGFIRFRAKVK